MIYAMGLIEKVSKLLNVAIDQVPAIIDEIYLWGIVSHSMGLGMGLLCLGFFLHFCKLIYRGIAKEEDWSDGKTTIIALGILITFVLSPPLVISNAINLTKILIAPKLYIMETIKND